MKLSILTLAAVTVSVATLVAACSADTNDKVIFKCTQTCPAATTVLPDICEGSDKSADQIARQGEGIVADSGVTGCTWSCSKTDSACRQQ